MEMEQALYQAFGGAPIRDCPTSRLRIMDAVAPTFSRLRPDWRDHIELSVVRHDATFVAKTEVGTVMLAAMMGQEFS